MLCLVNPQDRSHSRGMNFLDNIPRVSGRHRNRALAAERRTRSVEMALSGSSYQAIADELGYANRGTVYRIVQSALHDREAESIDELRQLEMDRLDALQAAVWPQACAGNLAAVGLVLKVVDRRARILGLYGYVRPIDHLTEDQPVVLW